MLGDAPPGFAELDALHGLDQEVIGAGAETGDHRLAVGLVVGDDHINVGRGLFHLLYGFERTLRVADQIDDQCGRGDFGSRSCKTRM